MVSNFYAYTSIREERIVKRGTAEAVEWNGIDVKKG